MTRTMRYHKYLIWFGLWALAALLILSGCVLIADAYDLWNRSYGPSEQVSRPLGGVPFWVIQGSFYLGMANVLAGVWMLISRFWLASLKRSARIALAVAHLMLVVPAGVFVMTSRSTGLAEIILFVLWVLLLVLSFVLHDRYYQKRFR